MGCFFLGGGDFSLFLHPPPPRTPLCFSFFFFFLFFLDLLFYLFEEIVTRLKVTESRCFEGYSHVKHYRFDMTSLSLGEKVSNLVFYAQTTTGGKIQMNAIMLKCILHINHQSMFFMSS